MRQFFIGTKLCDIHFPVEGHNVNSDLHPSRSKCQNADFLPIWSVDLAVWEALQIFQHSHVKRSYDSQNRY